MSICTPTRLRSLTNPVVLRSLSTNLSTNALGNKKTSTNPAAIQSTTFSVQISGNALAHLPEVSTGKKVAQFSALGVSDGRRPGLGLPAGIVADAQVYDPPSNRVHIPSMSTTMTRSTNTPASRAVSLSTAMFAAGRPCRQDRAKDILGHSSMATDEPRHPPCSTSAVDSGIGSFSSSSSLCLALSASMVSLCSLTSHATESSCPRETTKLSALGPLFSQSHCAPNGPSIQAPTVRRKVSPLLSSAIPTFLARPALSPPGSPLVQAECMAPVPQIRVQTTPTEYVFFVPLQSGVVSDMITVYAKRGHRLAVVVGAWHLEKDLHSEWEIAFSPQDVDMSSVRAVFGSDGQLTISIQRRMCGLEVPPPVFL
ncbi:hypothetical protein AcV5_008219 [Taiwanofungus camphoratus]|nr:hypothetical protein AcV5_008219 [Antrodia cinnamomea]